MLIISSFHLCFTPCLGFLLVMMPPSSESNESNPISVSHRDKLQKAARLYNFVSSTTKRYLQHFEYSIQDAMIDAGIPAFMAKSQPFLHQFTDDLQSEMRQNMYQMFEERKIFFDENMKIMKLKQLLTDHLNGSREFAPKSSLIIQAIKDGSIQ